MDLQQCVLVRGKDCLAQGGTHAWCHSSTMRNRRLLRPQRWWHKTRINAIDEICDFLDGHFTFVQVFFLLTGLPLHSNGWILGGAEHLLKRLLQLYDVRVSDKVFAPKFLGHLPHNWAVLCLNGTEIGLPNGEQAPDQALSSFNIFFKCVRIKLAEGWQQVVHQKIRDFLLILNTAQKSKGVLIWVHNHNLGLSRGWHKSP
mmetsp:Transcript_40336/g.77321  ORF Transcript_40336/g.77321 Transcript_40336/m.77321 type:complete len:201 (+) Transcript_40336:699-1301(+)